MADGYRLRLDASQWDAALTALAGPVRESLSRRMLVEGGVMLRDIAKVYAREADNKEGVERRGKLANAIYLAFDEVGSSKTVYKYSVSWNARKAPHGHLIEFGHWITHAVYKAANGEWYTIKSKPLDMPRWVVARPFMRRALDTRGDAAIRAMLERGKRELPDLLREHAAK